MTELGRRADTTGRGIDHVTIVVRDHRTSTRFYELALRPLGFSVVFLWPDGGRANLGLPDERSSLWLVQGSDPGRASVSLAAAGRLEVDAFHAAALAAGGTEVSGPSFRPEFTPTTYAAAVTDPDGNLLEAVCRDAVAAPAAA